MFIRLTPGGLYIMVFLSAIFPAHGRKKVHQTSVYAVFTSLIRDFLINFCTKIKKILSFFQPCCQGSISSAFHAHILRQYFCAKKLHSQNVTREKLCEAHSYKKRSSKMLMKLIPVLPHYLWIY